MMRLRDLCTHKITELWNHRIIQVGSDLGRPLGQAPAQSRGSSEVRNGCSGLHSGRSWIPPRLEMEQSPWVTAPTIAFMQKMTKSWRKNWKTGKLNVKERLFIMHFSRLYAGTSCILHLRVFVSLVCFYLGLGFLSGFCCIELPHIYSGAEMSFFNSVSKMVIVVINQIKLY